jgi:signal transduction histidine kinase
MGKKLYYWVCQILGWGAWYSLVYYLLLQRFPDEAAKSKILISVLFYMLVFIAGTHGLRSIIKRSNWLRFNFSKIVLLFITSVVLTSVACWLIIQFYENQCPASLENYFNTENLSVAKNMEKKAGLDTVAYYKNKAVLKDSAQMATITEISTKTNWHRNKEGEWKQIDDGKFLTIIQYLILIALWLLLYLLYHYVQKNRRDEIGKIIQDRMIKELEVKTIKAHINPHFIFNALNSIRALVDENPERARTAITELSNILRSSMQAEKQETVTLEKELNIIKDYLALEQIRFEERLKVTFNIDEDSLSHAVPPMMLQTLVENAVKHGISKLIAGGTVTIIADYVGDNLELIVENSGQITTNDGSGGFGIKSTIDRLKLMYKGAASFTIQNLNSNTVQSKITIPVKI